MARALYYPLCDCCIACIAHILHLHVQSKRWRSVALGQKVFEQARQFPPAALCLCGRVCLLLTYGALPARLLPSNRWANHRTFIVCSEATRERESRQQVGSTPIQQGRQAPRSSSQLHRAARLHPACPTESSRVLRWSTRTGASLRSEYGMQDDGVHAGRARTGMRCSNQRAELTIVLLVTFLLLIQVQTGMQKVMSSRPHGECWPIL